MRRTRIVTAVAAGTVLAAGIALAPSAFAGPAGPDVQEIPDGYYDAAEGLTGDALKSALHDIIDENDQLTYSQVKDAIADTDADPDNPGNIIMLYSGESLPADSGEWNREHTWAKSHGDFGTSVGPGTDLHHLRPTLIDVNSARGNLDFDNGGEELDNAPGNYVDGDSFEPNDTVKGDVARMILYMAVRYEGDDGYPDLEPNDQVGNNSAPYMGRLSVLLDWSAQDPPDSFEQTRNDVIYEQYQHNRNPFIDHPEWVTEIWS